MCRQQVASAEGGLVAAELEAFLGGRSLPSIALAVSVLASAVNGMNVVAIVGHYYAYGFHLIWTVMWIPITATFAAVTVVPLLYSLRVSTIFQVVSRDDFDVTTDENMWTSLVACIPYSFVRVAYDQMAVQRFMAARTARGAKRIAIGGGLMMLVFFVLVGFTGIAVIYWYRDCDPLLSGAISNYDQIIPYYIRESLSDVKTLRGLFLAGILSASTSTVSSVVNSNAATIYMDVVAPHFDLSKRSAVVLMRLLDLPPTSKFKPSIKQTFGG
nr:putative sodium-dependent multivitamin transporter [Dermacentor andersoni]